MLVEADGIMSPLFGTFRFRLRKEAARAAAEDAAPSREATDAMSSASVEEVEPVVVGATSGVTDPLSRCICSVRMNAWAFSMRVAVDELSSSITLGSFGEYEGAREAPGLEADNDGAAVG